MHIELSPKYAPLLDGIIQHLNVEATIINSFNASGETITLSVSKDDLEQILNLNEADLTPIESNPPVILEGLKAILRDHLSDRV